MCRTGDDKAQPLVHHGCPQALIECDCGSIGAIDSPLESPTVALVGDACKILHECGTDSSVARGRSNKQILNKQPRLAQACGKIVTEAGKPGNVSVVHGENNLSKHTVAKQSLAQSICGYRRLNTLGLGQLGYQLHK